MNLNQRNKFKTFVERNRVNLLNTLKTGARGTDAKEANYETIKEHLESLSLGNLAADVAEAAVIFEEVTKYELQVQQPPRDNGADRKLRDLIRDSSTCQQVIDGVDVRLDVDQLKHQHPRVAIGTRTKGGGNRFKQEFCTPEWHRDNTMAYMARWARNLPAMREGQQVFHGQSVAVEGIHYEGFCLLANGRKYVLFHCYPADSSPRKL